MAAVIIKIMNLLGLLVLAPNELHFMGLIKNQFCPFEGEKNPAFSSSMPRA